MSGNKDFLGFNREIYLSCDLFAVGWFLSNFVLSTVILFFEPDPFKPSTYGEFWGNSSFFIIFYD
jgi:hypothetical protein